MNHLPQAPENNTRVISNFFQNLQRYLQVKVHHRNQRHRWQILPPVPLVLLLPVANLPLVSRIPAANWPPCQQRRWQISISINDTGTKFATVVNTSGKQLEQYQTTDNLK
jgi:hypothetical protein